MKCVLESGLRAIPDSPFQISLPMQGVLRDVQHAFIGLRAHAASRSWRR